MPEALSNAVPVIIPALTTIASAWAAKRTMDKIHQEAMNQGILAGLKWTPVLLICGLMAFVSTALTIAAGINAA